MGLENSYILGQLEDDIDSSESQISINERSLFLYDQSELIRSIKKRLSKYEIKFLLDKTKDSNEEFWILLLNTLIKHYSLNSIKPYLSEAFKLLDIKKDTVDLLVFIKFTIMKLIDKGTIDRNMSRKVFENIVSSLNSNEKIDIPRFIKDIILYTDNESFNFFRDRIIKESAMSYDED